jgi:hypothetical protein
MSRWITLNIEGLRVGDVPELFQGMYLFEEEDRIVVYEFKSAASTTEKEKQSQRLALAALQAGAVRVVVCLCGDTSDYVRAKEYLSANDRKLIEGNRWSGEHGYRRDSQVIVKMKEHLGYRPNLGGNWYHESGEREITCV